MYWLIETQQQLKELEDSNFEEVFVEIIPYSNTIHPVENSITLLNSTNHTESNIAIYDMMGKPVQQLNVQLQDETIIPINLVSGIYILNIEAEGNFYNYKLI